MRRTLIIAIIAVAVIALGAAAYFLFFTHTSPTPAEPGGTTTLPVAGQGTTPQGGAQGSSGSALSATPNSPVAVSSRLVQISSGPVVPGEIVLETKPVKEKGATTTSPSVVSVQYVDRESGNVFSYRPQTKVLTRINNKTLPGIQSASWLADGSAAFVRYLSGTDFSTINTYALAATSSSSGFFLAQNLADISVSPTRILTLASGVNGSSASLARLDGSKPAEVFTTPLTAVRASFLGPDQYLVFSKPSSALAGSAYLVSGNGYFSTLAGPLSGLVALASPSGKWLLVSYVINNAMRTELVEVATHTTTTLPVSTIADKCVWAIDDSAVYCGVPQDPPSGYAYPDDWYQGVVSFSDRIWKINIASRYAQLVLDFSQAKSGNLDATALALDAGNTTLVFVNKSDGSLWSYSL